MTILISHRGNIDGPSADENKPSHILNAINLGYDVEIDLWYVNGVLYLGHDNPQYEIDYDFLLTRSLWIHCKNIESLLYLKEKNNTNNYFWHQEDDVTITSLGYFWTYPGKKLTKYSIAVLPELKHFDNISISYGVCSDYIEKFK
jgi:hypothetical protein